MRSSSFLKYHRDHDCDSEHNERIVFLIVLMSYRWLRHVLKLHLFFINHVKSFSALILTFAIFVLPIKFYTLPCSPLMTCTFKCQQRHGSQSMVQNRIHRFYHKHSHISINCTVNLLQDLVQSKQFFRLQIFWKFLRLKNF